MFISAPASPFPIFHFRLLTMLTARQGIDFYPCFDDLTFPQFVLTNLQRDGYKMESDIKQQE